MDRSIDLLRIEMDRRWSADDHGYAFVSLSDPYDLRLFLESLREDQRDLEHFYEELIHFLPFCHRLRRRVSPWGLTLWSQSGSACLGVARTRRSSVPSFPRPEEAQGED